MSLPPYVGNDDWIGLREAATMFKRDINTVREWCYNGTFKAFGIEIYQDGAHRWWIKVPKEERPKETKEPEELAEA